jgi:hypothetical protein
MPGLVRKFETRLFEVNEELSSSAAGTEEATWINVAE